MIRSLRRFGVSRWPDTSIIAPVLLDLGKVCKLFVEICKTPKDPGLESHLLTKAKSQIRENLMIVVGDKVNSLARKKQRMAHYFRMECWSNKQWDQWDVSTSWGRRHRQGTGKFIALPPRGASFCCQMCSFCSLIFEMIVTLGWKKKETLPVHALSALKDFRNGMEKWQHKNLNWPATSLSTWDCQLQVWHHGGVALLPNDHSKWLPRLPLMISNWYPIIHTCCGRSYWSCIPKKISHHDWTFFKKRIQSSKHLLGGKGDLRPHRGNLGALEFWPKNFGVKDFLH